MKLTFASLEEFQDFDSMAGYERRDNKRYEEARDSSLLNYLDELRQLMLTTHDELVSQRENAHYAANCASEANGKYLKYLKTLYDEAEDKGRFIILCVGSNKINNIKFHRELTGSGLVESKEFVESYLG